MKITLFLITGQILLEVDYMMKSLWHGVKVPVIKRKKLSERWRTLLDVNPSTGEYNEAKIPYNEFVTAGES